MPCSAAPDYTVDIAEPMAFSLCSAIRTEDGWRFGAEEPAKYEILESGTTADTALAALLCRFENNKIVREDYTVSENGVAITLTGEGESGYALPAFCFDGETKPAITATDHSLTVSYEGWICRYTTDGAILDLDKIAANRNGHYRVFLAKAQNILTVKAEILKA